MLPITEYTRRFAACVFCCAFFSIAFASDAIDEIVVTADFRER
ncbi:MAG: hypothetical protein RLN69_01195 [Woeseiaceae bacterium]